MWWIEHCVMLSFGLGVFFVFVHGYPSSLVAYFFLIV